MNEAQLSGSSFQIDANETIFYEGKSAQAIHILAKGEVDIYISPLEDLSRLPEEQIIEKSYRLFHIDQNIFIGANDLFLSRHHSFSYRASLDSTVFSYPVSDSAAAESLFLEKKEYSVYILNSIVHMTAHSYHVLQGLEKLVQDLRVKTDNLALLFWLLREKHGSPYEPQLPAFRESRGKLQEMKLEGPVSFPAEFLAKNHFDYRYEPSSHMDMPKMNYYKQVDGLGIELKKQFFGHSFVISQYSIADSAKLLENIQYKLKECFQLIENYVSLIYSQNQCCIFDEFCKIGMQTEQSQYDNSDIMDTLHYMISMIEDISHTMLHDYNHRFSADPKIMELKLAQLIAEIRLKALESNTLVLGREERRGVPEALENSAARIVEYAALPPERSQLFLTALKAFTQLKNKLSDEEQSQKLRKILYEGYYEIYEAVLKRVIKENNRDKLLHLFLNYAYMDEKLLSPRHLWTLYELEDLKSQRKSAVYQMKSWLQAVYSKEKAPSLNNFSMDYFDVFREMLKQGEVKEQDKAAYDNHVDNRLSFEINNFFKTNQRLCSRSLNTYVPILHDEVITRDLDKALVTAQKVQDAIQKVLDIDFSAFHRQISYFNPEKRIEKELIMQEVRPDVILMPVYGAHAMMWQEITGRVRNTPGRFIVPIFAEGNLEDMIQKLIGEFRWQLCKTMMGISWSDISVRSLTSEYMDYLQFFKKNKELSEDAKEKLRQQMKKYRNMSKDIFVSDYLLWLNYESAGNIRLSKTVREILYRYCPFSKGIRQSLAGHPAFGAAAAQFERMRAKEVRDLENRFARYAREGIQPDQAMHYTLNFYKDL
jgi:CRP-like cAMP-binding protein